MQINLSPRYDDIDIIERDDFNVTFDVLMSLIITGRSCLTIDVKRNETAEKRRTTIPRNRIDFRSDLMLTKCSITSKYSKLMRLNMAFRAMIQLRSRHSMINCNDTCVIKVTHVNFLSSWILFSPVTTAISEMLRRSYICRNFVQCSLRTRLYMEEIFALRGPIASD